MVDSVSGMTGMEMEPDRWDIDIVLHIQPESIRAAARPGVCICI